VQVSETVDVAAAPDRVWAVLVDVESWPTWTDSIESVRALDGAPTAMAEGSRYEVKQPRLPKAVWVVTELVDGRSFSWSARGPGLVSFAEHRVEPSDGASRVTLLFSQEGPLARPVSVAFGAMVRRYVRMEAAGLKRRSEESTTG
jgi:uncharacterized membrane protein